MPEKKWNNWIFQIPLLQYIQAISGGGRRAMCDSPLYNITCDMAQYRKHEIFDGYPQNLLKNPLHLLLFSKF